MANARSMIMADKEIQSIFAPNGTLLIEGQTLRLKKLADTLAAIAKDGMSIFYNGSIAQGFGGRHYKSRWNSHKGRLAEISCYREGAFGCSCGIKMVTIPPPASGGAVVILILKALSMYNMTGVPTTLLVHRMVEALKWSQLNDHGTSHICIVDRQRNVVTMTTSINTHFGSRFMSPSTGIFLNNQMHDFSIPTSKVSPGAPTNYVSPFKRPLSSMAPAILEKGGRVKAVVGSAGGLLIPDAVSQLYPIVLLHENYSSSVGDRYAFSVRTLNELKRKGHQLKRAASVMTVCLCGSSFQR
ncbi:UNVERIFIED_CONTAM: Glutathione hydrolase 1 [Sesamum radiatum]|uniref:Glutathione hydrolase 1 n=1 Tax=Sesamum radiatum TaxID=300843 RepID=A0AAW2PLH4_SESRA